MQTIFVRCQAVFIFLNVALFAENWPGWRGPLGTKKAEGENYPITWSRDKNVRWRFDLPERGNSSPVLWGDQLYAINQSGDAFVLRAAPKFELLATNALGEKTQSPMAFAGGDIFVRSYKSLWCISVK